MVRDVNAAAGEPLESYRFHMCSNRMLILQ